jgi:hypothetical protein
MGIYRGAKLVLWPKVGLGGPTCQASRPARVAGQPSLLAALTLGIGCPVHRPSLTHWQRGVWKGTNTWPAGQGGGAFWPHFGLVGPGLCATSFPHVIFSVTMPCLGHIEDVHRFWSIWWFSIIWCSWNGRSKNSLNSLLISTYLLYLEWNVGMLVVNICFLWLPTPPPHLEFCSRIKNTTYKLKPRLCGCV